MSAVPAGSAIIERIGWDGEDGSRSERFTATLLFPSGPPDLKAGVIFKALPVRIVLAEPAAPSCDCARYRAALELIARQSGERHVLALANEVLALTGETL